MAKIHIIGMDIRNIAVLSVGIVDITIQNVTDKPKFKWKLKDTKWDKFSGRVKEQIPMNYKKKNVNKLEKVLRKIIIGAANEHI